MTDFAHSKPGISRIHCISAEFAKGHEIVSSGEESIFSNVCRFVSLFFPDIPKVNMDEKSI